MKRRRRRRRIRTEDEDGDDEHDDNVDVYDHKCRQTVVGFVRNERRVTLLIYHPTGQMLVIIYFSICISVSSLMTLTKECKRISFNLGHIQLGYHVSHF